MADRGLCPECGSAALLEDAHYAQQQLVCAACGCVLAEGLLTTTYSDEGQLREVAYSQSTGQKEQLNRCEQRGIRRVQDLCKVLRLPSVFEGTAVSYLQRALQHPSFRLLSLEKKELLVGCCVLATCRQHNWPLTLGTICSLLYAKQELVTSVYLSLQKELRISVPALSLMDLVKTHLNSFQLFQHTEDIPAQFVEDKEAMLARTMQVVELASETWLVTGRHPIPIVTAAAFLSWQSLRPSARLTCTFTQFCKAAGIDLPPPARLRLKELYEILLRMAAELAWLKVLNLDKKTVVKYIGDLLQHRIFLLKNAFCAVDVEEQQRAAQAEDSSSNTPAAAGTALDKGGPSEGKQKAEGSRRPLLPPCLLHPKKRLRTAALSASDAAITGDEPISDSEIEQYLRGPEEIRAFRRAKVWQ
ncbi:transcription factor IIIB 50 kDa subunit [Coturnix japonica]|uniref:transcription factor IIIB 50 kDa subunit n=1 Tax=Coturnix japonica TaxID=93934 RepID=UPI0007776118|nr:transcription factor IIIB 50 kDa subunit [Coturnix japonica]